MGFLPILLTEPQESSNQGTVFLQPCHLAEGLDAVSTQERPGLACVCLRHSVARGALGVGAR